MHTVTGQEYENIIDHFASYDIRRHVTIDHLLSKMGLKYNDCYLNYIIVDKNKWMLAKIKHEF